MKIAHNKALPDASGVYFFKDHCGTIMYVGKAQSIKDRVKSYFSHDINLKTTLLLEEYTEIDFIVTKNETEALLLEAQIIQEHKPKYNVLLKDGQPFVYIIFTPINRSIDKNKKTMNNRSSHASLPSVKIVRNKKEKGAYFGPFLHKQHARGVLNYLIETFKLRVCNKKISNGCLDYHLGLCIGSCMNNFDKEGYIFRLELAQDVLHNNHAQSLKNLKEKIKEYNTALEFEKSQRLNQYLENLDTIFHTIRTRFHEEKYKDEVFVVSTPTGIAHREEVSHVLAEFLEMKHPIKTIDCFDVSHFQSRYLVGSCIRFTGGVPEKDKFRRFAIKSVVTQDDYHALHEIVSRRYKDGHDLPDIILIDGGKGQRNAVKNVYPHSACISLAKREETIFSDNHPEGKILDIHSPIGQLLIAIRDYAHHFAISYHKVRRHKGVHIT